MAQGVLCSNSLPPSCISTLEDVWAEADEKLLQMQPIDGIQGEGEHRQQASLQIPWSIPLPSANVCKPPQRHPLLRREPAMCNCLASLSPSFVISTSRTRLTRFWALEFKMNNPSSKQVYLPFLLQKEGEKEKGRRRA